jgi:hypothetical protein
MRSRRALQLGRSWVELRAIRFSIADQRAALDRARQSGAEPAEIARIEGNLKLLEQSLRDMNGRDNRRLYG